MQSEVLGQTIGQISELTHLVPIKELDSRQYIAAVLGKLTGAYFGVEDLSTTS